MKSFNTAGICVPEKNYMVDTSKRIDRIMDDYVRPGKYFTINRARQYGKTTTLYLLENRLRTDYIVISMSFEAADELFVSGYTMAAGFLRKMNRALNMLPDSRHLCRLCISPVSKEFPFDDLDTKITEVCMNSDRKIILMIDEVDKSSDNQIFLSFLGLLREKYLRQLQGKDVTFWSVILAGVYDVKNLKLMLHPGAESRYNSPWNVAVDFKISLDFSASEIGSMLGEYESDWHTGMDIDAVSQAIYEYTSGYPFLVSRLCQIMAERVNDQSTQEERLDSWNAEGFQSAVRLLLKTPCTLFDDMVKKLAQYPQMREMIYAILFQGEKFSYEAENERISIGVMFGFLKEREGSVVISNRIFEMKLYNLFLSEAETDNRIYSRADMEKNLFIKDGSLQMDRMMQKFCEYFEEIYTGADDRFVEENGRRIFLMFLKPIINGNGNYYIEARTRNMKRTDIIIDYKGVQHVLELKIWHGQEYNRRGEKQLLEYMDDYHLKKGYMLGFNFNKNKQTGIKNIHLGDRILVEAVV